MGECQATARSIRVGHPKLLLGAILQGILRSQDCEHMSGPICFPTVSAEHPDLYPNLTAEGALSVLKSMAIRYRALKKIS